MPAVLGKASQSPWMDLGAMGAISTPRHGTCLWLWDMVAATFSAAPCFGKPQLLLKYLSP